jgi:hypothetical protein
MQYSTNLTNVKKMTTAKVKTEKHFGGFWKNLKCWWLYIIFNQRVQR